MKRVLMGAVSAALLLTAGQAFAEDYVHHYTLDGKCFVIVTSVIGNNTYTTKYTCAEYAPIQQERLRESEREFVELRKRADERAVRSALWELQFNSDGSWPAIDAALNRESETKWYPDKRAKALTALTAGKTVAEMAALIKRLAFHMDRLPYAHFGLASLLDAAEREGLKDARFGPWTYHAFNDCGKKSFIFVAHISKPVKSVNDNIVTLDLGFGVDWYLTMTLKGSETQLASTTADMCE